MVPLLRRKGTIVGPGSLSHDLGRAGFSHYVEPFDASSATGAIMFIDHGP